MIDLNKLPKEIRDVVELKEATDMTFSRFCVDGEQLIFVNNELKPIKKLCVGDMVPGDDGIVKSVMYVNKVKKSVVKIVTDCMGTVRVSDDHLMVLQSKDSRTLKCAKDIVKGDVLLPVNDRGVRGGSYEEGVFVGAYLADGNSCIVKRGDVKSGCNTRYVKIVNGDKKFLEWCGVFAKKRFRFSSYNVLKVSDKLYKLMLYGIDGVNTVVDKYGKGIGNNVEEIQKKVPYELLRKRRFAKGFLDGYSSCDFFCGGKLSAHGMYSVKSTYIKDCLLMVLRMFGIYPTVRQFVRKETGVSHWSVYVVSDQIELLLSCIDFKTSHKCVAANKVLKNRKKHNSAKRVRKTIMCVEKGVRLPVVVAVEKVGVRECIDCSVDGNSLFSFGNGIVTHNCDEDYSDIWWNILAERANPNVEHSIICSVTGYQGMGKSMSVIAMACFMDPNFSVDNIYFGYDNLVYNRHKLKPNSVVIVDEQSEQYGLDSHRISIILQNLKEQLRKKSIHFFFCAPTLYPESKSSMYIIETMFIDYETQECYAALKTRDGLTLGHIRIPYPLKVLEDGTTLASKELMAAYEAKKDAHLEKVLGNTEVNQFDEWANRVQQHKLFKKAEKLYKRKMGYMPNNALVGIINRIFPEFQSGVVSGEIAQRIKMDKEVNEEWEISGRGAKKDKKTLRKKPTKRRKT